MIIGIIGYKGSGKSTLARRFHTCHSFFLHPLAGTLKEMLITFGLTPEQVYGDKKEEPCELLAGKTPRWAMQSIGTEWGRKLIADDIWIRAWEHNLPKIGNIVCDDVRFPNEARMLMKHNACFIKVERPGYGATTDHASERYADTLPYDHLVRNDGDPEDLTKAADDFMKHLDPNLYTNPDRKVYTPTSNGPAQLLPLREYLESLT